MKIREIKEEIHSKEGGLENRSHSIDPLDPRITGKDKSPKKSQGDKWKKKEEYTTRQRKRLFKFIIGILIFLSCLAGGYLFYLYKSRAFSPENIVLSIDLPQSVESGQIFPVKLLFHNNNRADLHDCKIKFFFPSNIEVIKLDLKPIDSDKKYLFFDLGKVKRGSNGAIEMELRITEKEQTVIDFNMILDYKLNSDSVSESKETRQSIEVRKSKISFELEATRQAASGNLIEYLAKIKNNTHNNLNNLELSIIYPPGFEYSGSSITPIGEQSNIFKIPVLPSAEEMEINIKGILKGSVTENKEATVNIKQNVDGALLNLAQDSVRTEMINSPLLIGQEFTADARKDKLDNINPGEKLYLTIKYQNSSDIPMKDVVIMVGLESEVIDKNTLEVENGYFNPGDMTINWKGGETPELIVLEPMEKGEFQINFNILDHLPSNKIGDKNFIITSTAQIDSPDVPTPIGSNKLISSDESSIKINSKILFDSTGFFNDNLIQNSGPIPPKVGKKTTYSIHWKIININNDLKDTVIKASLPEYVSWENVFYPKSEKGISHNSRTNEIIWNAGDVPAQTGTLNEAREIVFQIGLTPNETQIGQKLILLNQAGFTATDSFTNKDYDLSEDPIETQLRDDISISLEESKIVE